MATIEKSLLKTNKKTGKAEISFRFCGGRGKGLTVRVGSGIFITENRWSKDGNVIIPRLATKEREEILLIVDLLDKLENRILNEFSKISKEDFSKDWLEDLISEFHNPTAITLSNDKMKVLQHFEDFVNNIAPNKIRQRTLTKLQDSTLQQYRATYKHVKGFILQKYNRDIDFKLVNKDFYIGYLDYLRNIVSSSNTVGKHVRVFKTIIRNADYELVKDCNLSIFEVFSEAAENIYLTEAELKQIWELDLTNLPEIEIARDWFLIACYTGSRYSDFYKFKKTNLNEESDFIDFRQTKTKAKVVIPLHPIVKDIYKKYNWKLPEVIPYHLINDRIRKAVELAGITQLESISKSIDGKMVEFEIERYKLVGTHTGRRSFCTNMYLLGLPMYQIMSISGHKSEKNFLLYIKIKANEHAEMMLKEWEKIKWKNDNSLSQSIDNNEIVTQLTNEKNALKSQILDLINEKEELNNLIIKQQKEIIRLNIAIRKL